MDKRAQAGVQSVENGLDLMLIVAHNRRPMKITDIAEQAGISPSKAHRYLVSFLRTGFITQDPETGLYGMGSVALEFSLSCLATIEPISLATREAERLCAALGHTVAVSVWGSFGPTVVRWEQPARPVMVNVGLGSVFPLYRSATGRVFAAFMAREQMKAYLASPVNREPSADTPESIEQVRERGMARAVGDFMEGMSAFAAPVLDDRGRLVLTMTVLGYKAGFDHRWSGPVAAALQSAAQGLSRTLGYEHQRLARSRAVT
ncbi:YiaKLMNOPQRS operon repressor [Variovorax sp. SRS16]|uniref:IclR family transcriptional regulator n=1 Tax=Variovorax sp. SRS16 TaxID=282217 RepID=UPI00131756C8|nr:IclR family transcriptional regulator [Variovorax sp. SRS16]VTU12874.1 YiaKLMNOPQRS operon repressor [Variovorax sp. SRS16]